MRNPAPDPFAQPPPKTGPGNCQTLYALIAVNPKDGTEGICGLTDTRGHWVAMVTSRKENVIQMRGIAKQLAQAAPGLQILTRRYVADEDMEQARP